MISFKWMGVLLLCPWMLFGFSNRPDSSLAGESKAGVVTVQELSKAVERYIKQMKRISPDKVFSAAEMAEVENSTLSDLLLRSIFKKMAEKEKLTLLDSEVKERYYIVCSGLFDNDEKAFTQSLVEDGWTEAEYFQNLREIIISEKMRAQVTTGCDISEQDARDYYQTHLAEFTVEEAELAHILITAPDRDAPERGLKTIRTELLEKGVSADSLDKAVARELEARHMKTLGLLDSLKRGADFADLARRYSEDGTNSQGGALGWVAKGRMVKAFEDAGFALKQGEVSGIVRTEFGFHLIKSLSATRTRVQDLSEVEPAISARLRADCEANALERLEKKWAVKKYGILKKGL